MADDIDPQDLAKEVDVELGSQPSPISTTTDVSQALSTGSLEYGQKPLDWIPQGLFQKSKSDPSASRSKSESHVLPGVVVDITPLKQPPRRPSRNESTPVIPPPQSFDTILPHDPVDSEGARRPSSPSPLREEWPDPNIKDDLEEEDEVYVTPEAFDDLFSPEIEDVKSTTGREPGAVGQETPTSHFSDYSDSDDDYGYDDTLKAGEGDVQDTKKKDDDSPTSLPSVEELEAFGDEIARRKYNKRRAKSEPPPSRIEEMLSRYRSTPEEIAKYHPAIWAAIKGVGKPTTYMTQIHRARYLIAQLQREAEDGIHMRRERKYETRVPSLLNDSIPKTRSVPVDPIPGLFGKLQGLLNVIGDAPLWDQAHETLGEALEEIRQLRQNVKSLEAERQKSTQRYVKMESWYEEQLDERLIEVVEAVEAVEKMKASSDAVLESEKEQQRALQDENKKLKRELENRGSLALAVQEKKHVTDEEWEETNRSLNTAHEDRARLEVKFLEQDSLIDNLRIESLTLQRREERKREQLERGYEDRLKARIAEITNLQLLKGNQEAEIQVLKKKNEKIEKDLQRYEEWNSAIDQQEKILGGRWRDFSNAKDPNMADYFEEMENEWKAKLSELEQEYRSEIAKVNEKKFDFEEQRYKNMINTAWERNKELEKADRNIWAKQLQIDELNKQIEELNKQINQLSEQSSKKQAQADTDLHAAAVRQQQMEQEHTTLQQSHAIAWDKLKELPELENGLKALQKAYNLLDKQNDELADEIRMKDEQNADQLDAIEMKCAQTINQVEAKAAETVEQVEEQRKDAEKALQEKTAELDHILKVNEQQRGFLKDQDKIIFSLREAAEILQENYDNLNQYSNYQPVMPSTPEDFNEELLADLTQATAEKSAVEAELKTLKKLAQVQDQTLENQARANTALQAELQRIRDKKEDAEKEVVVLKRVVSTQRHKRQESVDNLLKSILEKDHKIGDLFGNQNTQSQSQSPKTRDGQPVSVPPEMVGHITDLKVMVLDLSKEIAVLSKERRHWSSQENTNRRTRPLRNMTPGKRGVRRWLMAPEHIQWLQAQVREQNILRWYGKVGQRI